MKLSLPYANISVTFLWFEARNIHEIASTTVNQQYNYTHRL